MASTRNFQLKYKRLAEISITIEAGHNVKNSNGEIFWSNLDFKSVKHINQPLRNMLRLKIKIDKWLKSIGANEIYRIEIQGSLFLGYFAVKDLLLKQIPIHEVNVVSKKPLAQNANYIFRIFEGFVASAILSRFTEFPSSISSCSFCDVTITPPTIQKDFKLSVVIPTRNETLATLTKLLTIVAHQILVSDEIVLVDDNVTELDGISDLTRNFQNLRLVRGNNQGIANTRNVGLIHATGDLISFIDSDDYVSENFFKIQRRIHGAHPAIAATGTWLKAFGEHSRVYPQWDNFNPLGMRICLPPAGVLIWKKNSISELNGFSESFKQGFEDFDLITRAILKNQLIVVVDSIEYFYQRGQASLSQSWSADEEMQLLGQVLLNSKKLCDHKFVELLEIVERFGPKLNFSSIDQIFTRVNLRRYKLLSLKKFRNNRLVFGAWEKVPNSLKRIVFGYLTR